MARWRRNIYSSTKSARLMSRFHSRDRVVIEVVRSPKYYIILIHWQPSSKLANVYTDKTHKYGTVYSILTKTTANRSKTTWTHRRAHFINQTRGSSTVSLLKVRVVTNWGASTLNSAVTKRPAVLTRIHLYTGPLVWSLNTENNTKLWN